MHHPTSILIVDDEPLNFEVLESFLGAENYELHYVPTGTEAIEFLGTVFNPDLILMDLMMPGMDGVEACRHIKAVPQWRTVPIIMITALNTKNDLARCLQAGADDFIAKPVHRVELLARVHSMLRIKRQYDEIQQLTQTQQDTIQFLERGLSQIHGSLSSTLSHEMNTPLHGIMTSFALLERKLRLQDQPITTGLQDRSEPLMPGFSVLSAPESYSLGTELAGSGLTGPDLTGPDLTDNFADSFADRPATDIEENTLNAFDLTDSGLAAIDPNPLAPSAPITAQANADMLELVTLGSNSAKRLELLHQKFLNYLYLESATHHLGSHQPPDPTSPLNWTSTSDLTTIAKAKAKEHERLLDLSIDVADALITVNTKHCHWLLNELLDNAFKFSLTQTPVQMTGAIEGELFRLRIRDRGQGMTPEQIQSVGAFMQFERSHYEQQGTGLGLCIAQKVVDLYGGAMSITSVYQQETMISIDLPLAPAEYL